MSSAHLKQPIPLILRPPLIVTPIASLLLTLGLLNHLSSPPQPPPPPASSKVFTPKPPLQLPPVFQSISATLHLPAPLSNSLLISDISTNTLFHIDTSFPSHAIPLLSNAGNAYNDTHAFSLRRPGIAGMALYDSSDSQVRVLITRQASRDVALLTLTPSEDPASITPTVTSVITLTTSFNGSRFNSPHSIAIDANHGVIFSDPSFGLILEEDEFDRKLDEPEGMEQEGQHVYRLSASAIDYTLVTGTPSEPRMLLGGLDRPTGIALVGNRLYVATSSPRHPELRRYELWGDGVKEEGLVVRKWKQYLHGWGQKQFTPVIVDHLLVVGGKRMFVGAGDGVEVLDVEERGDGDLELVDKVEVGVAPGSQNVATKRGDNVAVFVSTSNMVMVVETRHEEGS